MSCQYSLFSAVAVVDVLCPGPTSCHPLLCLGTPSPALPGGQAQPAPWAFPLLSLRSDRALSPPLPGSPALSPARPCSCCSRTSWKCPGVASGGPGAVGTWEPAPGPVSGAAAPGAVRAGPGEQLQPGQAGSIPAGQLDTRTEPGSVTIPAPPAGPGIAELFSLGLLPWSRVGSAVARGCALRWPQGRAVPSGGPRAAPQLLALLDSASVPHPAHSDPVGALGSCCSPWPRSPLAQEPPGHPPLCCRTGLCSLTCGLLGHFGATEPCGSFRQHVCVVSLSMCLRVSGFLF